MSTSVALGASATAIAISAEQQARRAECLATFPNYNDATASVKSKQHYASCIQTVYPDELSPTVHSILWWGILMIMLALVAGIFKAALEIRKQDWRDWSVLFFYPIVAAGAVMVIEMLILLIGGAIQFLMGWY